MEIRDEWVLRLRELAESVGKLTDAYFDFSGARPNVTRQVSEAEMLYISEIKHLIGYIDSLTYDPPRN